MKTKSLGDRMKEYEFQTCSYKMIPRLPVIARLDGKSFSSFTRGLEKPYDKRLSDLMVETTKYLVKETNANVGYTQSDEITLLWYTDKIESSIYFDGKLFKMIGDLAASASVFFNSKLKEYLPEKADKLPRFDARVFNLPNLTEAVNCFLWRENDAVKNSITLAASEYYSHKELYKKNGNEKQEMLFQKGVNWNDYPSFFKRGSYIQRKRVLTKFTAEEINKLPKKHKARENPDLEIERWSIDIINMPPLGKVGNAIDVIVYGEEPLMHTP